MQQTVHSPHKRHPAPPALRGNTLRSPQSPAPVPVRAKRRVPDFKLRHHGPALPCHNRLRKKRLFEGRERGPLRAVDELLQLLARNDVACVCVDLRQEVVRHVKRCQRRPSLTPRASGT